jgi:hypothetical protein
VPSAAIEYSLAMSCIESLQKLNDLELVVLMGGEPGLYPDLTHRLATAIADREIAVRVETNAFWATDPKAAHRFLDPLASAGASVMYSLDAFHEPFVSPDCVERAIRAAEALGMAHNLEVAYLDHGQRVHEIDRRTEELLRAMEQRLDRSPCCKVYEGNVFYNGRAARVLADLVAPGRGVPEEVCDRVPWWSSSSLETLDLLILDAAGYLSKGCGIAIADIKRQCVRSVLESYDAQDHPVFSTLLRSGPLGLAREAAELGYVLKEDYADRCHLCQEARDVLGPKYPGIMVPAQHYLP